MRAFVTQMKTSYGSLNFYFNPVNSSESECYHVSVIDTANKLNMFHMIRKGSRWVMSNYNATTLWIIGLEKELNSVIRKNTESVQILSSQVGY